MDRWISRTRKEQREACLLHLTGSCTNRVSLRKGKDIGRGGSLLKGGAANDGLTRDLRLSRSRIRPLRLCTLTHAQVLPLSSSSPLAFPLSCVLPLVEVEPAAVRGGSCLAFEERAESCGKAPPCEDPLRPCVVLFCSLPHHAFLPLSVHSTPPRGRGGKASSAGDERFGGAELARDSRTAQRRKDPVLLWREGARGDG
jgi:hypothetical protein